MNYSATSVAFRGKLLFAGNIYGTIVVFNTETREKVVEISSNSQLITGISLHPTKPVVNLYPSINMFRLLVFRKTLSFKPGNTMQKGKRFESSLKSRFTLQISLSFRSLVPNSLLCGVQFCGENGSSLVVSAYECDLMYWMEGTQ